MTVLVLIAVLLVPPYYHNWQLEQYMRVLAREQARSKRVPDLLRALVVDKAAGLGLPVRIGDVRVTPTASAVTIDVLYIVHIDLPVYTVDLHFRPSAS